jgi:type IV pilus assembly protein PilB
MGITPSDIASAANAIVAQRLVRKLCDCKTKIKIEQEDREKIEETLQTISKKAGIDIPEVGHYWKAKGCSKCNNLGYKGRTIISEVLIVNRPIQDLINRASITSEIQDKAVEEGMLTMEQDGILKVLEGETTLEEVKRVTSM